MTQIIGSVVIQNNTIIKKKRKLINGDQEQISNNDDSQTQQETNIVPKKLLYCLKRRSPRKQVMVAGSYYIAKPNSEKPLGEDAHFICQKNQTIGVADGVGGCAKYGVDAGEYARELMDNALDSLIKLQRLTKDAVIDPKGLMIEAYENTTRSQGACTACIITHNARKRVLSYANIGDSGFMLFRNKKCCYVSKRQQHDFNFPYQLGNFGKKKKRDGDRVESAYEGEVEVEPGDIVVVGSDGLFDNMYANEIEEILTEVVVNLSDVKPMEVAWRIGMAALANSDDCDYYSPFAMAAEAAGRKHSGGKVDDITVIVACIIDAPKRNHLN